MSLHLPPSTAADFGDCLGRILDRLDTIEKKQADSESVWLRGDLEAATYAGYRSRQAFLSWARSAGIKPRKGDLQIRFWLKADILNAQKSW